jgi:hypothetical protein
MYCSVRNDVGYFSCTVVGANLCVRQGIREARVAAHKEACTIHTTNIIPERQYSLVCSFGSHVGNVFGLRITCTCVPPTCKFVT